MSSELVELYRSMGYREAGPSPLFGRTSQLGTGEVAASGGYMEGSGDMLFGAGSQLGSGTLEGASAALSDAATPLLIGGWLSQLLIMLMFIGYVAMLWRSWGFASAMVLGMVGGRDERRLANERGELPLSYFKSFAILIGIVAVALVGVRSVDCFLSADVAGRLDGGVVSYAPLIALLLVVVVIAWQYALHKIVEWLTMADTISELASLSVMNFVRSVVALFPLVACWLVAPADSFELWTHILLVGCSILLIIYLKDIFVFFVEKKIPFLYLILYLCGAILLPLSFLITLLPQQVG